MPVGTVKWFNAKRGFGFVVSPDVSVDVFVHHEDIQAEGFRTLEPDEPVMFDMVPDAIRGARAKNIVPLREGQGTGVSSESTGEIGVSPIVAVVSAAISAQRDAVPEHARRVFHPSTESKAQHSSTVVSSADLPSQSAHAEDFAVSHDEYFDTGEMPVSRAKKNRSKQQRRSWKEDVEF